MLTDWLPMMVAGGVFVLLGLAGLLFGRHEEKSYYDALAGRRDVREYVAHQPERSEPGASKVGGWIAIAIGLILMAVAFFFRLRG